MNSPLTYLADLAIAQDPPPASFLGASPSGDWEVGIARKGALITIVDDDEWVRKSLDRLIKSAGFRTRTFASAEDFVAAGDHRECACIILDLRLPGMSGLDLQAYLTAERSRVPIVFVSAHDEQTVRNRALHAGAVAFLGKPVDDEALLDAINLALK
jgi:FixJ family two-component response regulator